MRPSVSRFGFPWLWEMARRGNIKVQMSCGIEAHPYELLRPATLNGCDYRLLLGEQLAQRLVLRRNSTTSREELASRFLDLWKDKRHFKWQFDFAGLQSAYAPCAGRRTSVKQGE